MSKDRDRVVYKHKDGWAEKRNDATRAGSVQTTQKAAEDVAREKLTRQGGGELITKGRNGKIRSKDTIGKGNDPFPPRDTEH